MIHAYRRSSEEGVIARFPLPRTVEIGRRVEESSLAKMCDGDAVEDMKYGVWHVLRIWRLGCRREVVKKLRGKYCGAACHVTIAASSAPRFGSRMVISKQICLSTVRELSHRAQGPPSQIGNQLY
jgi:hypothetical protein